MRVWEFQIKAVERERERGAEYGGTGGRREKILEKIQKGNVKKCGVLWAQKS